MFRLDGRVALVTGGSRGIGRAICKALAGAGATVLVNYQSNEGAAREVVTEIEAAGGKAEALRFDVANADAVDSSITDAAKRHGKLDILVCNAGIARDQLLLRVKQDEIDQTFATNVNGALFCARTAVRLMMRARYGRIIFLSSVVGEAGNPGQAVYAASKAALFGITKTLAREYASRGVTVNAVSPGFIETDMTATLSDEAKKGITDSTPLGRVGKPEEVAAPVLFLASEEAGYVTGHNLSVNGGMHM